MTFGARGEHVPLRTVTDDEVDPVLAYVLGRAFSPFVSTGSARGLWDFARIWARTQARDHALALLRRLPRFQEVPQFAITGHLVPEYDVRWRDYSLQRLAVGDWLSRISDVPKERRMFMALHVHPEASTDYWVRHDRRMIDYQTVTVEAVQALSSAGWRVALKDHPNMFGFRKREYIERLVRLPGVVLVPTHVPAQEVIQATGATFTFQGTVGLQGALGGRTSVVVGEPYYFISGHFVSLMTPDDVPQLPKYLEAFVAPGTLEERQRRILSRCLEAIVPGDALSHPEFRGTPADVAAAAQVGRSIAEWAPRATARVLT
jgi:hypothetical protein